MKRQSKAFLRPWWSVEAAASYLRLSAGDLRELSTVGTGPKYTEAGDGVRHYRPADVRLWAKTGLVRDRRSWNGDAR
ncbi:hypothetical protein [Kitasatospora phosalacinea]|uniref:Helix-turn-helix domain-containing protein n=1 Tax=Kitasatospora phosalacinea TaxID=2065 RepID=A0A9W6PDQ9_9ACTN|nr:hypothetical protein [Kitasatospora phosalacinea]GLW53041.1 hypothetical protein Kpho01_10520 [Kitasatospora phosalacinea]